MNTMFPKSYGNCIVIQMTSCLIVYDIYRLCVELFSRFALK